MGGVATSLRMFPAEKIAIAVLTNSSSLAPHLIADEIMTTLMPDGQARAVHTKQRTGAGLRTEDANRRRYVLSLSLKLLGDVLNGAVTARSLPGKRVGNALTQWAELKKQ